MIARVAPNENLTGKLRNADHNQSGYRKDRTASDPWPLIDHEARCGPMDQAGTLADPQQSHEQSDDADDQDEQSHGWVYDLAL